MRYYLHNGTAIALIVIGAILKMAVNFTIKGVDLQMIGTIMLAVGVGYLILNLILAFSHRNSTPATTVTTRDEYVR